MLRFALSAGIALVLLPLVPSAGRAQDYRGRVQGSVFDETRAVLPGVTITLRNDATGVTNIFVTNELGHYIFDFVDPGLYRITAELPGFKKAEQLNVPELNISSTNFGKVTRKRADGSGREIQAGLRFVF